MNRNTQPPWALCLRKWCVLSHFCHVQLFVTPWTVACQVPLSMGFFRQGYWSGIPCPPPGDLLDPGTERDLLCLLQVGSLPLVLPREKVIVMHYSQLKQVKSAWDVSEPGTPLENLMSYDLFPALHKSTHPQYCTYNLSGVQGPSEVHSGTCLSLQTVPFSSLSQTARSSLLPLLEVTNNDHMSEVFQCFSFNT